MRVHVKHAPDLVVLQVVISLPASVLFSIALQIDSIVDESLGSQAARLDLDVEQVIVAFPFKAVKVAGFGYFALAANQYPGTRLRKMPSAPEIISLVGH
jgi:hypothetical protein